MQNINLVENFIYNGFSVTPKKGFAKYTVEKLIKWTDDPGIGLFICSDKKERLIPSCQLTQEFLKTQPKRENKEFNINNVFGTPSKS